MPHPSSTSSLFPAQLSGSISHAQVKEASDGVDHVIAYRAERYLARDLLPDADAVLYFRDQRFALHDLAMRGVSVTLPRDALQPEVNEDIRIRIEVHDKIIYDGVARVVREETSSLQRRVALQLHSGLLDVVEVRRCNAEARLARHFETGPQVMQSYVPQAYRDVVGRIAHFIQYHKRVLEEHAQAYQELGLDVPDISEQAYMKLCAPWFDLCNEAAGHAQTCFRDVHSLKASKGYTEDMVTSQLLSAPFVNRAYLKPLGYPGDFETTLLLLDHPFVGETIAAKVFNKLACNEALALSVQTRKDFLKAQIVEEYERWRNQGKPGGVFRVASLACGPAREAVELILESAFPEGDVQWTLFDQDERALRRAYHDVCRAFASRQQSIQAQCVHVSFSQLLSDASSALRGLRQNMVYAAGLFDCLRLQTARKLLGDMIDYLEPGGFLSIGNATRSQANFWFTEFVLDWTLLHRDREHMEMLIEGLQGFTQTDIHLDSSQACYFLSGRKAS